MGKRKKKSGGYSWAFLVLGVIIGAASVIVFLKSDLLEKPPAPVREPRPPVAHIPPIQVRPLEPVPAPPVEAPVPPEKPPVVEAPRPAARLAIVIDDMGADLKKLKELISIGEPITVAVMPNMRFSKETSREASANGLDVIMHLPMEPRDASENNPGVDALLTSMTPEELKALMDEAFRTVPDAIGINNHMGSKFTEDEPRMRTVLEAVKMRGMLFLDSRTSANSVGGRLAKEIGVRNADRNVFLDNNRDVSYIKGQLAEAARIARKRGRAIAIGHPYPETIRALKEAVPALESDGVEVVRLSDVIPRAAHQARSSKK